MKYLIAALVAALLLMAKVYDTTKEKLVLATANNAGLQRVVDSTRLELAFQHSRELALDLIIADIGREAKATEHTITNLRAANARLSRELEPDDCYNQIPDPAIISALTGLPDYSTTNP